MGAALTLPMVLASGPLAGFILGHYIIVKYFGLPSWLVLVFVCLGFLASGLQTYRLIQKIQSIEKKK